jgi:hypothetical protein
MPKCLLNRGGSIWIRKVGQAHPSRPPAGDA